VVLALPFTALHRMVEYRHAGFNPRKATVISEYRLGTNAKHHLQFTQRHWRAQGSNGETFADTGYQNSWEVSRAQPGSAGILVDYTGGTVGSGSNQGSVMERSRLVLAQLEPVLPAVPRAGTARLPGNTGRAIPGPRFLQLLYGGAVSAIRRAAAERSRQLSFCRRTHPAES
jgi:monoamine oxidase